VAVRGGAYAPHLRACAFEHARARLAPAGARGARNAHEAFDRVDDDLVDPALVTGLVEHLAQRLRATLAALDRLLRAAQLLGVF
jgi:hypothetical protein